VIALMKRVKGATLAEIMAITISGERVSEPTWLAPHTGRISNFCGLNRWALEPPEAQLWQQPTGNLRLHPRWLPMSDAFRTTPTSKFPTNRGEVGHPHRRYGVLGVGSPAPKICQQTEATRKVISRLLAGER
jgi:hypothetical protein